VTTGSARSSAGRSERGDGVVTLPDGPVQVFDVELSGLQRLPPVDGGPARLLVRRHGAPVTLCVATCAPDVQCVSEARVRRAVREAGFTSACTVKNALSAPDDPPYTLSRLMVMATTTDDELIGWLAGRGVPVGRDDERLLTRGWRWWRRARARVGAQPPGWADAA
jgi:hypothetical protein